LAAPTRPFHFMGNAFVEKLSIRYNNARRGRLETSILAHCAKWPWPAIASNRACVYVYVARF